MSTAKKRRMNNSGDGDLIEQRHEKVVFTFGRFQPPTTGHAKLIHNLEKRSAEGPADAYVFVSSTADAKKNPLSVYTKVKYLKKMHPGARVRFINTTECGCTNVPRILDKLLVAGYEYPNITMVIGADRADSFKFLKERGAAVITDDSLDRANGMSGTKMREAAIAENFTAFAQGTKIGTMSEENVGALMKNVREGLGLRGGKRRNQTRRKRRV